ncbi:MAG: eL32 family ribosomal protein [Candidatus Woesearchaeota archaeon]
MKFVRHAAHRKKRLDTNWRRPRGLHNKMRLERKGSRPRVKEGYRTAVATRNTKKGLLIVRVHNVADVEAVDAKTQGVVVASIGMKKKLAVLKRIKEKNLTLLTGSVDEAITELTQRFSKRQEEKKSAQKQKEERQKELEEQAKEKEESVDEDRIPLSKIKGVGPATIKKLEEAGISSAQELVELSEEELSQKVEGVSAKSILEAAKKVVEGQDEKDKVLTKAR